MPIRIPNNFSYDFYTKINVSLYQLMKIYAFIVKIPKVEGETKLRIPVKLPVLYDFMAENKFPLSIREVNILFEYVYQVIHEFSPAHQHTAS